MTQYAHRVMNAQQAVSHCALFHASQPMSQFATNLTFRRESLGLEVTDVAAELNRRGFDVAYSTVAGWFNGSRGKRWDVDELKALLDILQTDLQSMTGGEAELVEGSVSKVLLARKLQDMPEAQAQALLALLSAQEVQK